MPGVEAIFGSTIAVLSSEMVTMISNEEGSMADVV